MGVPRSALRGFMSPSGRRLRAATLLVLLALLASASTFARADFDVDVDVDVSVDASVDSERGFRFHAGASPRAVTTAELVPAEHTASPGQPKEDIVIAVAANFLDAANRFAEAYEQQTGHRVTVVSGATGKLYAQIRHGAPFDVFLAADVERPQRLIDEGFAVPQSAFTYALGVLSLWYPQADPVGAESLCRQPVAFLAMANPDLAPYGAAAKQAISALGRCASPTPQIVVADNVAGAFSLVATGNAQAGFVAYSHLVAAQIDRDQYWVLPAGVYAPIAQMAVLLKRAEHRLAAQGFMAYLQSPAVQAQLPSLGYAAVREYD